MKPIGVKVIEPDLARVSSSCNDWGGLPSDLVPIFPREQHIGALRAVFALSRCPT